MFNYVNRSKISYIYQKSNFFLFFWYPVSSFKQNLQLIYYNYIHSNNTKLFYYFSKLVFLKGLFCNSNYLLFTFNSEFNFTLLLKHIKSNYFEANSICIYKNRCFSLNSFTIFRSLSFFRAFRHKILRFSYVQLNFF